MTTRHKIKFKNKIYMITLYILSFVITFDSVITCILHNDAVIDSHQIEADKKEFLTNKNSKAENIVTNKLLEIKNEPIISSSKNNDDKNDSPILVEFNSVIDDFKSKNLDVNEIKAVKSSNKKDKETSKIESTNIGETNSDSIVVPFEKESLKTTSQSDSELLINEDLPNQNDLVDSSKQIVDSNNKKQSQFVVGIVNKADMQSFEEWKEMKLKEALKESKLKNMQHKNTDEVLQSLSNIQQKEDLESDSNQQIKESSSEDSTKLDEMLLLKRRKNYASLDCGAKLIAYNPESSNPSHILTESKDEYMLNSCSSKTWFVIELCETIKINEIELANFELFSNVPKQFKIYTSERFIKTTSLNHDWPSKYLLGTFEAANTRTIQSFSVKDVSKDYIVHSIDKINENEINNINNINSSNISIHITNNDLIHNTNNYDSINENNNNKSNNISNNKNKINDNNKNDIKSNNNNNNDNNNNNNINNNDINKSKINNNTNNSDINNDNNNNNNNNINNNNNSNNNDNIENEDIDTKRSKNNTDTNNSTNTNTKTSTTQAINKKLENRSLNENNNNNNATINVNKSISINHDYIIYSKYIKVEMISHYGTEHYCPLSLIRIYGSTIIDEDDNNADENIDDLQSINSSQDSSKPAIFKTSTSIPMVNYDSKLNEKNLVENENSSYKVSSELKSIYLNNLISVFLNFNFVMSNLFQQNNNLILRDEYIAFLNKKYPLNSTKIFEQTSFYDSKIELNKIKPISLDLDFNVSANTNMMNLLEIDLHKMLCFSSTIKNSQSSLCCRCQSKTDFFKIVQKINSSNNQSNNSFSCFNWLNKYCGYYFLIISTIQAKLKKSLLNEYLRNMKLSIINESYLGLSNNDNKNNFILMSFNNYNFYIVNEWIQKKRSNLNWNSSIFGEKTYKNDSEFSINLLSKHKKNSFIKNKIKKLEKSTFNNKQERLLEIFTKKGINSNKKMWNLARNDNDYGSSEVSNKEQNLEKEKLFLKTNELKDPQGIINKDSLNKEIITKTTIADKTPSITTTSSVTTAPIVPSSKDTLLVKLNNRIKVLELNMSLSSQYLEKLSQHYKKQMDEMQEAFNLTTTALLETIKLADDRDVKQNERISNVEKRLDKAVQNIDELNTFLNDVKFQTKIIMWTMIVLMNLVISLEIIRCVKSFFSMNNQKSIKQQKIIQSQNLLSASITSPTNSSNEISQDIFKKIEHLIEIKVKKAVDDQFLKKQKSEINEPNQISLNEQIKFEKIGSVIQNQLPILNKSVSHNLSEADYQQQQQAAVMQQAFAVVAAVSIAAATASCSTLNQQQTNEEIETYVEQK